MCANLFESSGSIYRSCSSNIRISVIGVHPVYMYSHEAMSTEMTSTTATTSQTNSTSSPSTTNTTTETTTTPSTTLQTSSTTANATHTTQTGQDLPIPIIVGASVGGFFLIVIVIAVALFLCRKRRPNRKQSPPPLPDPRGLPASIDGHDSFRSDHTWNGSRTDLLPPRLPPSSPHSGNYEDPNRKQSTMAVLREDSSSHSTYANTYSQGPGSSAGSYVVPLDDVPVELLFATAEEATNKMSQRTHPKAPVEETQGTFESHYMEMDPMKNRDSGLTESGNMFGSQENMYMPPDIAPPPCSHGLGLSLGYVNVPADKKQAGLQTQQSGEHYENFDNHQYRNVSPDLIISSNHSPSAKSLHQMATPEKVRKTLKEGRKQSPVLTQQKVPPSKVMKPAGKATHSALSKTHSAKIGHHPTHHDQSHLHAYSSSLPGLSGNLPDPAQSSSDSDDEPQLSYENVPEGTGPKAHGREYENAPDKKTEPEHKKMNAKVAIGTENAALKMSPGKPLNNGAGPTKADKIKKLATNPQGLTAATVSEELTKKLALKKKHIDKVP